MENKAPRKVTHHDHYWKFTKKISFLSFVPRKCSTRASRYKDILTGAMGGNNKKDTDEMLLGLLKKHNVDFLPFVPDAGHARLIDQAFDDPDLQPIVLTTEEEGVAFACGNWLGGKKSVLLMQSSGVGNTVNMLSLVSNCNFPFVTLITMRGDFGEFNSWQVPMGKATPTVLMAMGIQVLNVRKREDLLNTVDAALYSAFSSDQRIAVLISQNLVGRKEW